MVTPSVPPVSSAATAVSSAPAAVAGEPRLTIEIISSTIRQNPGNAPVLHLRGTVTDIKSDGTVIITTDRGTLTVRMPPHATVQPGQRIDIDLPVTAQQQLASPRPDQHPLALARLVPLPVLPNKSGPAPNAPDPALTVPVKSGATAPAPDVYTTLRNLAARTNPVSTAGAAQTTALGAILQLKPLSFSVAQSLLATPATATATTPPLTTAIPGRFSLFSGVLMTPSAPITSPLPSGKPFVLSQSVGPVMTSPPHPSSLAPVLTGPSLWAAIAVPSGAPRPPFLMQGTAFPQTLGTATLPAITDPVSSFGIILPGTGNAPPLSLPATHMRLDALTLPDMLLNPDDRTTPPLPTPPSSPTLQRLSSGGAPLTTATQTLMTVIGQGSIGGPILSLVSPDIPESPVYFQIQSTTLRLPNGATLSLTPLTTHTLTNTASPGMGLGPPDFSLQSVLADLDFLLSLLPITGDPVTASPRALLPQAAQPQQLGAAALFFLAAIRSGDVQGWLGERAIDALRRSAKGTALLEKLSDLFSATRQRLTDVPAGEWRSYPLPLTFQNQVVMLHLHTHSAKDDGQGNDGNVKNGQRFVLDLSFDRMGAVQMDMLYQQNRLDSILRTESPLSRAMRGVLETKYAGAMGKAGLTGTLNFQDGLAKWVTINPRGDDVKFMA